MSRSTTTKARTTNFESTAIKIKLSDDIFKTIRACSKYGFWAYLVYNAAEIIAPLAGKKTDVSVLINFLTDSGYNLALFLSLLMNVGLFLLLRNRMKLCENERQRFAGLLADRERAIDPERTTSGLTERGKTRPEDL